jgi:hypothetical protein
MKRSAMRGSGSIKRTSRKENFSRARKTCFRTFGEALKISSELASIYVFPHFGLRFVTKVLLSDNKFAGLLMQFSRQRE